jgi:hypothetical protein
LPQVAALLEEAAEDILAYKHFPKEHQQQLHSTESTAVVYATTPRSDGDINLLAASVAWQKIMEKLLAGESLFASVESANTEIHKIPWTPVPGLPSELTQDTYVIMGGSRWRNSSHAFGSFWQ